MKRIDILVCLELFNIRKQKSYPKQVIKDSYDVVRRLCFKKYPIIVGEVAVDNYNLFKEELKTIYLSKSTLEYKYCLELLSYLDQFERFVEYNLF